MKNIVIVGCGKGIGLAIAKIVREDHQVIGISKSDNTELHHPNVTFYPMDILTGNVKAIDFPETIDGIIYTPGSINLKPISRLSENDFKDDFEINVLGAVKIIRELLPNLKKSGNASVVLFSTVAAKIGMPFHASVAASKSALEGLTKSLAAEFAIQKIRVNAIAPSLTDTPLAAALLSSPEKVEGAAKRHPLQRVGKATEIAEMAVFLISDKASWITGQIIGIDGGMGSLKT